jgi:hypothetical protein
MNASADHLHELLVDILLLELNCYKLGHVFRYTAHMRLDVVIKSFNILINLLVVIPVTSDICITMLLCALFESALLFVESFYFFVVNLIVHG